MYHFYIWVIKETKQERINEKNGKNVIGCGHDDGDRFSFRTS